MSLRRIIQTSAASGALALTLALAAPAAAQESALNAGADYALAPALPSAVAPSLPPLGAPLPAGHDTRPVWQEAAPAHAAPAAPQIDPRAREAWLSECRRRSAAYYDNGYNNRGRTGTVLGGLFGGLAGGLIGNRIDNGPDRAVGTVVGAAAGAVIGAVAGNAIGKARNRDRSTGYDYCEAYLDDYYRTAAQGHHGYHGGHHGGHTMHAAHVQMVPVQRPVAAQVPCEEVVTEEYVPEVTRSRTIPHRAPARRVRDKRVRVF